jgi:hypothetical protein
VVVQNFAVAPGEVQLDPGLSGTIDETMGANQLPPGPAKAQQVGRQVADADRASKGITKQLASFLAEQGWTQ